MNRRRTGLVCMVVAAAHAGSVHALSPLETLPPTKRERVRCSLFAAKDQGVPADVMLGVAELEGGKPGQWVRNRNGTYDVGPMQFNTRYIAKLHHEYGITASHVAAKGCGPYWLAAKRLRKHLTHDKGDVWTRAANYHSRTPRHNRKYRAKLYRSARKWRAWVTSHYPDRGVTKDLPLPPLRRLRAEARGSRKVRLDGLERSAAKDASLASSLALLATNKEGGGHTAKRRRPSAHRRSRGHLLNGRRLPPHPRYRIRNVATAWGAPTTVGWLQDAFDQMTAAPVVMIHDLSKQGGGPLAHHKSHQSGLDVDIAYYQRTCDGPCLVKPVAPAELDAASQWRLLQHWLQRGQLRFAFVDYRLQRPLFEAAKQGGASASQLAKWFQYPRGEHHKAGIIRHVPNHHDHVHVRFRCTAQDDCGQAPAPGNDDPTLDAALLELLDQVEQTPSLERLL